MPNLIVPTNPLFIDNEFKTPKYYLGTIYKPFTFVTRYQCQTENKDFPLYIPNVLLNNVSIDVPSNIIIGISISTIIQKPLGFLQKEKQPLYRDREKWEYEYQEINHGNTFEYMVNVEAETKYKIYIPKSEFLSRPVPKKILLTVHELTQITKDYILAE